MFTLRLFRKCLTHPCIYKIPTLIFSEFKHIKLLPNIYCNLWILTLSKILNELFLGKQASKLKQPKSSPSVIDSMVSASQMVSLHQTISSIRVTASSHATQLSWFFFILFWCFLLCWSCQLICPFHCLPIGHLPWNLSCMEKT